MFNHIKTFVATIGAVLLMATSAQATLVGRDINGNAVAGNDASSVFLYDTDLNITWLRNANAAAGSIYDNGALANDGRMTWDNAVNWVNNLTVGVFGGWRLPAGTSTITGTCDRTKFSGDICGYNVDTATSEMAHLYYDVLGNLSKYDTSGNLRAGSFGVDWGLVNVGDFLNMKADSYWSGAQYYAKSTGSYSGMDFDFSRVNAGLTRADAKAQTYSALAVRPGDVLVQQMLAAQQVSEPESLLLALTALSALALVRGRKPVTSRFIDVA